MAYNKAKEERKWILWKEAEEHEMRRLGVSEDIIQRLHAYDWEVFKADRRFYEREMDIDMDADTYLKVTGSRHEQTEIRTVGDLLESIESRQLYRKLILVDKLTLQIAVMKMQGYETRQIAESLTISEKAVYRRIDRLRKKLKKFLI